MTLNTLDVMKIPWSAIQSRQANTSHLSGKLPTAITINIELTKTEADEKSGS